MSSPRVKEYMTKDVDVVQADDTVQEVSNRIKESANHDGFPVCDGDELIGFITPTDLLLEDYGLKISSIMQTNIPVSHPDMKVTSAARVMFREGTSDLPVINDSGDLIGIITNTDVIRSQIERATPSKVGSLQKTLKDIHNINTEILRKNVPVTELRPTQKKVFADELKGREFELERGLAEPLVVIENGEEFILADGHHRALAAKGLDMAEIEAYVLKTKTEVELGLSKTAQSQGLESLEDVDVDDEEKHPLVERTNRFYEKYPRK